ncbi:unnamed protein product [Orchesella dallaii]|uniref:Uncharacterized protein n=1 Tax=Orchesella dallaii TaxID=48710 RepID=A0ABP1R6S7_9HEXA
MKQYCSFIVLFTLGVIVTLSSAYLIPSLSFSGCSIQATREAEDKVMPELASSCENKVSLMDLSRTNDDQQDCINQCLFGPDGLSVFKLELEVKLQANDIHNFYHKYTNASSGQMHKLSLIHETCNVETNKELQALKQSSSEVIGSCKYFGMHEACAYKQYQIFSGSESTKLC